MKKNLVENNVLCRMIQYIVLSTHI
jgi:hypothetical protein